MTYELDFERPLAEIDKRIQALHKRGDKLKPEERARLAEEQQALEARTRDIYSALTPWQRVQVARHRLRPYTKDYIAAMCDDFFELRGDRRHGDDRAIIGGVASLGDRAVMLVGHQKGRTMQEREECRHGMPHPEGYRKALRLFEHAERMRMPVVTLIDTAGAYLALEDEQRGIALSIAENLRVMAGLRTPIVCVVIGEGGSGGALGISVGDRILMMENAIYTVASPEAAASILWRDAKTYAPDAAEAMKITARDLLQLGLIEEIIPEPLGGAHRDYAASAAAVKAAILTQLDQLERLPVDTLLDQRYERFRRIGSLAAEPIVAAL